MQLGETHEERLAVVYMRADDCMYNGCKDSGDKSPKGSVDSNEKEGPTQMCSVKVREESTTT